METWDDVDEMLSSLVSAKNRWFNSGGYTPTELVFGELPRVPGELLSDNSCGLQTLSDAFHDPAGLDEAGAEFRHRNAIRERAKQLAMAETKLSIGQRALLRLLREPGLLDNGCTVSEEVALEITCILPPAGLAREAWFFSPTLSFG